MSGRRRRRHDRSVTEAHDAAAMKLVEHNLFQQHARITRGRAVGTSAKRCNSSTIPRQLARDNHVTCNTMRKHSHLWNLSSRELP